MRHLKKLASLLLALAMIVAMSVTVFAAGTNTITVKNAISGQKYELYKILDLSVNDDQTAYSYTVNSDWENFFKAPDGKGLTYVSIDKGYVTWKTGADVAAFAKDAEEFAKDLTALDTITATTDGDIKFDNLEAGYYLVTSTLGTKATVGTTPGNPNPEIQEKNEAPTNVKTVEEDSTPGVYGEKNDADIGQTVNFKSTITAQPGAENYVFEDTMSAGLTYNNDAKVYTDETMTTELNPEYYDVDNNPGDGKTFTITFKQSYLDTINVETKLYVKYSATLNGNAVVGLPGNSNKSALKYGDSTNTKSTPDSETKTYTWDMGILKYGDGNKEKVLKDAQFVLLSQDKLKVAIVVDGKLTGWENVPTAGTEETITWPANTILTTGEDGKIHIDGLDADTYYLREIKAPAGYNELAQDQEVVITGAVKADGSDSLTYNTLVVEINNNSGTELPSTGGTGTTIFYVLGSILVIGAGVLLVTKKRMNDRA